MSISDEQIREIHKWLAVMRAIDDAFSRLDEVRRLRKENFELRNHMELCTCERVHEHH